MNKVTKIFSVAIALVLAVPIISISLFSSASAQSFNPVTLYSIGSVKVNNISKADLYNFTTDLQNDSSFYPGVESTVLVQAGDPVTKVGEIYIQRGTFGGFPFETTIEVTGGKNSVYVRLKGTGPGVSYDSVNAYYSTPDGGAIFSTTAIITGIGLTPEFQDQFVQASFGALLNVIGKTGTVYTPVSFVISSSQVPLYTRSLNVYERILKRL